MYLAFYFSDCSSSFCSHCFLTFWQQGNREEMIKIQKEYEDKEKDLVIQLELKQEHDMYLLNRVSLSLFSSK